MGSYNLHSSVNIVNPIYKSLVAGGSSGGSCAAVGAKHVPIAFGSDTGGSINFPAHCCKVYGFKPSYGWLSWYGLIQYSSSNDVPGIVGSSIDDIQSAFSIVDGHCDKDSNSKVFKEIF